MGLLNYMNQTKDFDGFLTPEGELVSIKDTDRMFSIVASRTENVEKIKEMLQALACECSDKGYFEAARAYIDNILSLADTSNEKARCLLAMGRVLERANRYGDALDTYLRAFDYPQESNETWYFLNNNLAFCLNQASRHHEAERHCRDAIRINPNRHNAHKNLGIALQGLKRHVEAARSFIAAIMACPEDGRALALLEELIAPYPKIMEQEPDLLGLRQKCYEAVQKIRGEPRIQ